MKSIGENTGNMVFGYSLDRLLKPDIIPYNYRDLGYKLDDYQAIVCTDLIWIREESNFEYLNKILDDTQKPLVPISIGLQANSYNKDFVLPDNVVYLLKRIQERALIGVRGEYTAQILEKYGIDNISVIGCPSLYYWNNPNLKIVDNVNEVKKVMANFRTIYGQLTKYEKYFLSYAADRNMSFIEQTRHVLKLENTNDSKYYAHVSAWMEKNKKLFFSVEDWMESMCDFHFSLGARFHGNVISLWNNMKSLFVTIDSRTSELTDYFKLPSIKMDDFMRNKSIEYYYEKADYTLFNKEYRHKFENFQTFLKKNGLEICPDTTVLQFAQNETDKAKYVNNIEKIVFEKKACKNGVVIQDTIIEKQHEDYPVKVNINLYECYQKYGKHYISSRNDEILIEGEITERVLENMKVINIKFSGTGGNRVIFKDLCTPYKFAGNFRVEALNGCKIVIGRIYFANYGILIHAANSEIIIEDDVMLDNNVMVRAMNYHSIYSFDGKRISNKRLYIGKHVWIGYNATVHEGAEIDSGCVIESGSEVFGKIPNNCLVVGNPAQIVQKDIFWQFDGNPKDYYDLEKQYQTVTQYIARTKDV